MNKSEISTKIKILYTFDLIQLYYPHIRLLTSLYKRENPHKIGFNHAKECLTSLYESRRLHATLS
jgi:hypothetical protein